MSATRGIYIDGVWTSSRRRDERVDRWTGERIGSLDLAGADHAKAAVEAAARVLGAAIPVHERSRVLAAVASAITAGADRFAEAIRADTGKPLTAARTEVERAAGTFANSAEEAKRLPGERVPLEATAGGAGLLAVTVPEPRGIVAAITPFNFPLNLVAHKVGPAIAAGCPVVLKPSDKAPTVAMLLVEEFERAGLPAGWLNVVHGPAEPIVDAWLDDDRVAVVNFTGSAAVGWSLKGRSPRKLHILELGSNTAMYVHRSADLPRAVRDAVTAGFANSGQACISLQRLFVDREIADEFLRALAGAVADLASGDPTDPLTVVGPLITDAAVERVTDWVAEAERVGARRLAGGGRDGAVVAPTLLADVDLDARVMRDEVFGPVIASRSVSGVDEAIDLVNRSRFGLNTSVYSADLAAAMTFAEKVRSGTVLINMPPSFRADHMPYGGVKDSGQGREGVRYAVAELVEMKLIVIGR